MANGPFPPVDPNALGDVFCLSIDRLLVPYLLGVVDDLTEPGVYDGDYEDIVGTVYAFEDLIQRLTLGTSCMVGQVIMLATAEIPSNCLPCDGGLYNRVDYPALYAVISPVLKVDADHFRTPAMADRYPYAAGTEYTAFATGGESAVTLTTDEIPAHNHSTSAYNHTHTITDPGHNHTQNSHNHTQNSHNHAQDSHNHTQNSHNHTQDAHLHDISHTHTMFARDNGLVPGSTSRMAKADGSGTNSTPSTQTQSATNSGNTTATNQAATATNNSTTATNQATTATNNATTATNQASTTGIEVDEAVALTVVNNTGGGEAHNNLPPLYALPFAIVAK